MLLECGNCGAPLDAKPDARIVKCVYCGHNSRIASLRTMAEQTPLGWHPPPVWTPPAQFPAPSVPIELHIPSRKPAAVIAAALAVVLIGAGSAAAFMLMQDDALGDIQFGTSGAPTMPAPAPLPPSSGWDGKSTLTCSIGQELIIDGKDVTIDGTVIDAAMTCRVLIRNSKLKGRIVVAGAMTAQIRIENSTLEAEEIAVDCAMRCDVTIERQSRIKSKQTAIRLAQTADLRVKDSTIDAEETAISAGSASSVRLDRSTISGKLASLDVESASKVYLDRTKLIGKRKLDKGVRVTER